ncbi:MAG: DUF6161 domain-containing protein [Phycisphaerales bacterium]
MPESQIRNAEELLKGIPPRGQIAVAVRYARRVLPLLADMPNARKQDIRAAESILSTVENVIAGNGPIMVTVLEQGSINELEDVEARPNYLPSMVAAALAARHLSSISIAQSSNGEVEPSVIQSMASAEAAKRAARDVARKLAMRSMRVNNFRSAHAPMHISMELSMQERRLDQAIEQDVMKARGLYEKGEMRPDQPIELSVFGPLWPDGGGAPWPSPDQFAAAAALWGTGHSKIASMESVESTLTQLENTVRVGAQEAEAARRQLEDQQRLASASAEALKAEVDRQRAAAQKQAVEELAEDRKFASETRSRLDTDVRAAIDEMKKTLANETTKIASVYREKMSLNTAVQYWADRAISHGRWARAWGIIFLAATASAVCLFIEFGARLLPGSVVPVAGGANSAGLPQSGSVSWWQTLDLSHVAATAITVTLGIWILRILARLFLSNLHLERDCRDKEIMTKAFLSLRTEGAFKDGKGEDIMLGRLFQSAGTGLGREDANPTHIIAELVRGGK